MLKSTKYQVNNQVVNHVKLITRLLLKEIHKENRMNWSKNTGKPVFQPSFHQPIQCYSSWATQIKQWLDGYWLKLSL